MWRTTELSPCGRADAGTWGIRRPYDGQSLVAKYSPLLEAAFHRHTQPVWLSWRLDETYIRVKGEWKYLYYAVDKHGHTIDFLLTE